MSVYTAVSPCELTDWLNGLDAGRRGELGALRSSEGIAAGVENSNYFVHTDRGCYVLTLFERLSGDELDFYLALMAHLARKNIPCPHPFSAQGRLWRPLAGKPASLVSCLPGVCVETPTLAQVTQLGKAIAQIHFCLADFPGEMANPRGMVWRAEVAERLSPRLPSGQQAQLLAELGFQARQNYSALPQGVVHADLFRDNVLWQGEQLSGILDFYFAGRDALLYDLAVAANDWCEDAAAVAALIAGYERVRQLTDAEHEAWSAMRRAAALRFWLSRLDDHFYPRAGTVVTVKDPAHFAAMLMRLAEADEVRA